MKVNTNTIMHQAKFAARQIESIMYPAKFAGGRSRLDLLLPSFLPSREEKKIQDRIFCPLRGHAVRRMQYAPTACRQKTLYLINSQEERTETKMQEQKNRPLGCRGVSNTPPKYLGRDEKKTQDRIFCPLRGHAMGRMQYAPTSYRQEMLFQINSREERTETKMQDQKNRPLGSRGVLHTPPKHLGRDEQKIQDRIFYPLRGHSVGRMQYAPTTYRQEALFPINSREERIETKIQEQKNRPLGCRGVSNTPSKHLGRDEQKMQEQKNRPLGCRAQKHTSPKHLGRDEQTMQDRIFCPLRGHAVGRMQYAPTSYRQETLFPINSREERIETKVHDQKNHPLGCRGVLHTPSKHLGREEKKKQDRIFCPLRGHAVGRMQYAPTTCRQESMFQIILLAGKEEKKIQDQKNRPLGCRGVSNTPPKHPERDKTKKQDRIFCPLRGHLVGRMRYAPTTYRQKTLYLINSQEERTETKMQDRRKQSIDSGAEWHTPFMRQGERDAVWRDTFLEQRARVAIWRDRRLEEKYSHARLQLSTFGKNSKPYKSSLVALSEQLRDIFAA